MIAEPAAAPVGPEARIEAPEHGYGWLPSVLPARCTRFRVADPALRDLLDEAGAQIVRVAPEVEIGPVHTLYGDAEMSIAVLGRPARSTPALPLGRVRAAWPVPLRALRRIAVSLELRASAQAARRQMLRLGHDTAKVMYWDHQMAPAPTQGRARLRARALGLLPQRALVIGHSGSAAPTVLDTVRAQAARATGQALADGCAAVRTGGLVVDAGSGVLRVGVGHGRLQVLTQRRALAQLRAGRPPSVVMERIPWERAGGVSGIAEWSLERRLPGRPAARPIRDRVLSDCLQFLVALHGVQSTETQPASLVAQAQLIAAACPPATARHVAGIGRWLEDELADIPRGYAHGDFFPGNLLVDHGRLCGVVDWEAAGPGRLPFIDLLHLRFTSLVDTADIDWGPMLARHLLRGGGVARDEAIQTYAARLDLDARPDRVRALVIAYWLDYAAWQLRTHPQRRWQARWIERNIEGVLGEITRGR